MFRNIILILLAVFIFSNCGFVKKSSKAEETNKTISKVNGEVYKEEKPDTKGSIVEFPVIAKMTLEEIDEKFGYPESKKDDNKQNYHRTFSINNGEAELIIVFNKEKQVTNLSLVVSTMRESSDDILKAAGFDLKDEKPDWENTIVKDWKNRVFNGIRFEEISAGMSPPAQKWDEVSAKIER